jgi:hypothetical protein
VDRRRLDLDLGLDWGWAPFHYGRWFLHDDYGWLWVPGTEWAPAWVDWRHGDGWVGWAPLPPHVPLHRDDIGLVIVERKRYIPITSYCFVEERYLLEPRIVRYITPPRRNHTLIPVTRNVTNYVIVNKRVIDRSIDVKYIERVVRKPIRRYRIVEKPSYREMRGDRLRGDEVIVIRPKPKPVEPRLDHGFGERERQAGKRDVDIRRPRFSPEPTHPVYAERRPEQRAVNPPSRPPRDRSASDPGSTRLKRVEGHPEAESGRAVQRDNGRERPQGAKRSTPVPDLGPGAAPQSRLATLERPVREVRRRHLDRWAVERRGASRSSPRSVG